MTRRLWFVLLVVFLLTPAVQAQDEFALIPIKEYLPAAGVADIIVSVYDAPQGGALLYRVTKSVHVIHALFDDLLEVPAEVLRASPQVFIEFTTAADPGEPLADERMQFTQPEERSQPDMLSPSDSGVERAARSRELVTDISMCFSCGGAFPFLAGTVATRLSGTNLERGRGCGGRLRQNPNDSQPRICYGFHPR